MLSWRSDTHVSLEELFNLKAKPRCRLAAGAAGENRLLNSWLDRCRDPWTGSVRSSSARRACAPRADLSLCRRGPAQRFGLALAGAGRDQFGGAGLGAVAAEIGDDAIGTVGLARLAHIAAVQDQPVMSIALVFGRRDRLERGLDRQRRLPRGESGAIGHPENVRVDRDRRLAKGDVQHDIGGLATDPGQRLKRGAVARDCAAMLLDENPAERDHVLRLRAEQTDRPD